MGYALLSSVGSALGFYSRGLSIVMRAMIVLVSCGLVTVALIRIPPRRWADPALWVMFGFWLMLLGRFLWDASVVPIPMALPWFENLVLIIGVSFLPALALAHVPDEDALVNARRLLVVMGSIAAPSVIIAFARALMSEDRVINLVRLGTESLNPISTGHLGVSLVIVSVLAVPQAADGRWIRLIDKLPLRIFAGVLGLALTVASNSKGPLLALIVACAAWVVGRVMRSTDSKGVIKALLAFLTVGGVVAVIAVSVSSLLGFNLLSRFEALSLDRSTAERLLLMKHALQQFEESPLFGDAVVETTTRFYPHNLPVDALMTTGVIGFMLYFGLTLYCIAAAWRLLRTRHSWIALLFVQFTIASMFSGSAYFDAPFWAITALLIAADRFLRLSHRADAEPCRAALSAA
jgi:O-antigen ligase